jgi:hypothetical protein
MEDSVLSWIAVNLPLVQFSSAVVTSIAFLVAVGALIASATSARQSVRAHNFKTFQDIRIGVNSAWHDFLAEKDDNKKALLLQNLLNEYESACLLFNRNVISREIRKALDNYIVEGILIILNRDTLFEQMCKLRSRENVYSEIRRFTKGHKGAFRDHPRLNEFLS